MSKVSDRLANNYKSCPLKGKHRPQTRGAGFSLSLCFSIVACALHQATELMSASNVTVNIAFNEWPACGRRAEEYNLTFWSRRKINTSSCLWQNIVFPLSWFGRLHHDRKENRSWFGQGVYVVCLLWVCVTECVHGSLAMCECVSAPASHPRPETQEALRGSVTFLGGQKWKRDVWTLYAGWWIAVCR